MKPLLRSSQRASIQMPHPTRLPDLSVRLYRAADESDILAIGKSVYDGNDRISRILPYVNTDPDCFSFVAEIKHKVVGFVLFRRLPRPDAKHQVFCVEGGRIQPGARNHGVGYETVRVAIPILQHVHARSESYRFLASIDSYNKPSQRVFQKLGWPVYCISRVWPDFNEVKRLQQSDKQPPYSILKSFHLHHLLSPVAHSTLANWRQLLSSHEILTTMIHLRDAGSTFLMHRLFGCDPATRAAHFLQSLHSVAEDRSVWSLVRHAKPPVLMFFRGRAVNLTDREPDNMYSACVVDWEGAECCLAFADRRHVDGGIFRIAFEGGLSVKEMQESRVLSKLKWEEHVLFEKRIDGKPSKRKVCQLSKL